MCDKRILCNIEPATHDDIMSSQNAQSGYCEIILHHDDIDDIIEENVTLSPYFKCEIEEPPSPIEEEVRVAKWTDEAITALVYFRIAMEPLFRNGKIRKSKLWERVIRKLRENNFYYSTEQCEEKFCKLLGQYKMLMQKKCLSGINFDIEWKWIHDFHKVYQYKPSLEKPADYLLGSTLEENVRRKYHRDNLRASVNKIMSRGDEYYSSDSNDRPSSERLWNRATTNALLQLRIQFDEMFQTPGLRKNRVWPKVAKGMRQKGYNFSAKKCAVKYRNLLGTYKKICQRKEHQGTDVVWEWFDIIDKIEQKNSEHFNAKESANEYEEEEIDIVNDGTSDQDDILEDEEDDNYIDLSSIKKETDDLHDSEFQSFKRRRLDSTKANDDSIDHFDYVEEKPSSSTSSSNLNQQAYWNAKLKIMQEAKRQKQIHMESQQSIEMERLRIERTKVEALNKLANAIDRISRSPFFQF